MDVFGSRFGGYDPQRLAHVRQELLARLKPPVLRLLEDGELDEEMWQRILGEDLVDLSTEAKELLAQLRQERRQRRTSTPPWHERASSGDFLSLLTGLESLRLQVEAGRGQDDLISGRQSQALALAPLSSDRLQIARSLVIYAPNSEAKTQLAQELQVFGATVLQRLRQFGVRIIVLDAGRSLSEIRIHHLLVVQPWERTHDGRLWSGLRAGYCSDRRLFVVGIEQLGQEHRSLARQALARAFDHAASDQELPLP